MKNYLYLSGSNNTKECGIQLQIGWKTFSLKQQVLKQNQIRHVAFLSLSVLSKCSYLCHTCCWANRKYFLYYTATLLIKTVDQPGEGNCRQRCWMILMGRQLKQTEILYSESLYNHIYRKMIVYFRQPMHNQI